jgi:endonuclease/exonuclease/phosphatase family metal-dependent hydrolase
MCVDTEPAARTEPERHAVLYQVHRRRSLRTPYMEKNPTACVCRLHLCGRRGTHSSMASEPTPAPAPAPAPAPGVVVVCGASAEGALQRLQRRDRKAPPAQREIFVEEAAAGGEAASQLGEILSAASAAPGGEGTKLTVVSCNVYYGQCVTPASKAKAIDPRRTLRAIEALFDAGADVVCLQEVVGGPAPEGLGKDEYGFDFFPKEDFAAWPTAIEEFRERLRGRVEWVWAPAQNSTMYRYSFGNAVVVRVDKGLQLAGAPRLSPKLTEPTEAEKGEGRSAALVTLQREGREAVAICCTHLTEQVIGEPGQKQMEMLAALLQAGEGLAGSALEGGVLALTGDTPTILCGDFNINNVQEQPTPSQDWCMKSPFLHAHADHDPYALLSKHGFRGAQFYAQQQDLVLATVRPPSFDCFVSHATPPHPQVIAPHLVLACRRCAASHF